MTDDKLDDHKSDQIVYKGVSLNLSSSKLIIIVPRLPRMQQCRAVFKATL